MVARRETRNATYADIERLPEHVRAELIDGVLYEAARPRGRHVVSGAMIQVGLGSAFGMPPGRGGGSGWWILPEPECHLALDRRVVVPDLAGWRLERMPHIPESHKFTIIPDWVCEILSPSTQGHDYLKKMPLYLEHGVPWIWLVDPGNQRVEVYRAEAGAWELTASAEGDTRSRLPPFESAELDLGAWWGLPAPAP